jgi:spermidine synthase
MRPLTKTSASAVAAILVVLTLTLPLPSAYGGIIFERTSAYHHIRVIDEAGRRTLSFDGTSETRMSLQNSLQGHFEYTEFFHMPWLWVNLSNVLMIGLGGGSTQRAYQHYCPDVTVETVEIDPAVVSVAREYFFVKETEKHQIQVADGRVFLRRSTNRYDAILMDAYTENRYGSFLPLHMVTREFFQLASDHLVTNGVLAYNVIGQIQGYRADLLGAMYRTLKSVFPEVYLFPADDSQNVVFVATKSKLKYTQPMIEQRTTWLLQNRRVRLPTFKERARAFRAEGPPSWVRSPVLTDDFSPIEGLLKQGGD